MMKIYVAIPINPNVKGGIESLHQMASACSELGYETYVFYFKAKGSKKQKRINTKYKINCSNIVEDKSTNLIVVPETYTYILRKYKNIKKCIWFLSLDYYLKSDPIYNAKINAINRGLPIVLLPLYVIFISLFTRSTFKSVCIQKEKVPYYLYNCEYANNYIRKVCKYSYYSHYLCGPIDDVYFNKDIKINKERIVAYNPKKCNQYTHQLIAFIHDRHPEISFIPIINMSTTAVRELLAKTSVYLDLGRFPGPERLPREAVMMKCNIITSTLGSAGDNDLDVPIDESFKFELTNSNMSSIQNLIIDMIENYSKYVAYFDKYREKVCAQKEFFKKDLDDFLKEMRQV